MNSEALAVIDATPRGNFEKLTLHRMPGALPFAGKFRLLDFALSNLTNSGITNVAIFPAGNYRSMQDHVGGGKRWNLDRRRDGLFMLPPKNMMLPTGDYLTFQRMHEHIEYFRRSTQKYVLIMPPTIVWNIDFNEYLERHIESQADITEIVTEKIRPGVYICERDFLMKYIMDYDILPYRTMRDLCERGLKVSVNTLTFPHYARLITNPSNYLRANLDMLKFEIGRTVFSDKRPIVSKEKTGPPARYTESAVVDNSMVASGSLIQGYLKNSVIGRDVIVKKGAVIEDSVLMNDSIVESGAYINHAVLDKATVVKKDTVIEGSLQTPFVSEKGQVMTDQSTLRILHVASEVHPFVKTGGLADVLESLSRAQRRKGLETSVILPLYKSVKESYSETYKYLRSDTFDFAGEKRKIRLYSIMRDKVRFYFIENFTFFERDKIYGYDDDCTRFAFFNYAIRRFIDHIGPFDVVHVHDWHAALLPGILKRTMKTPPPTLLTIHNIDYQGVCSASQIGEEMPTKGDKQTVNFLESGIHDATKVSTVSPTYRDELRYEYYGKNLTPSLLKRERDFYGVLNGISKKHSPNNDPMILSRYDAGNIAPKTDNKLFLQKEMRLPMKLEVFLIGMVSRIVEQKGFPILIPALKAFFEAHDDVQFVLLGSGDDALIKELEALQKSYPRRIRLNIGYDSAIPNHIYAGSDLFLMPSRVEPCGLSQMIAMRYGTLPLVRKTGGLADSVEDYDPLTKAGTGFTFFDYDADYLKNRLEDAYEVFKEKRDDWRRMQKQAMKADFSLELQAQKILEIYQSML